jgi:leader peptidase (prepilin peptidase)/N-methyltransferase
MLFALWLTLLVGFVALCVYDYRWQILPDKIVATSGIIVLLHVIVEVASGAGMQRVIGALWGIVFGAGIFWLIFQISDGRLIGGGDVKLGIVYGILLGGPIKSLLCIFIASLLGTLFALPAAVAGKASRTTKIPFGPFLIAATVIVYLFGSDIVTWYRTLAGI